MTRSPRHVDGSLALKLDFGSASAPRNGRRYGATGSLSLAGRGRRLMGPDKFKDLEHRRRQAQIRARHLLDLMEEN